MRALKLIVVLLLSAIVKNDAARILAVIPTPSISHQVVFRPLLHELVNRGHEVVLITTDPAFPKGKAPTNLTEIDVHDISYNTWREAFLKIATGNKNDLLNQLTVIFKVGIEIFKMQMESDDVQEVLQDKKGFDLLILEALSRQALGLSHIFEAPIILMSSFGAVIGNREVMGAPTHPFLYPMVNRQRLYNLTWIDKISEAYSQLIVTQLVNSLEVVEANMLKEVFGADIPSIDELQNRIDMMFLNVHPIWEGNFPVPPSVIYTGGLHQNTVKELPKVFIRIFKKL